MPQTLNDIKSLLAAHGLRPRHRYGQNFLHDANQMKRILAAAEVHPGDLVLEVGPGTGALSEWLLEAGARLVAVEIDRDLEPILRERVVEQFPGKVTLLIADVLAGKHEINPAVFEALEPSPFLGRGQASSSRRAGSEGLASSSSSSSPKSQVPSQSEDPHPSPLPKKGEGVGFKLIANLPYNVASPLLANLVLDHPEMTLAVVMIQREVADRLTAEPGGKEYGPLGVLIQAMCHVERIAALPASCFWPPPKVASAVVRTRRRDKPLTDDPHALSRMLHTLFSKRRKQIGTILGRERALPPGISPESRPEQLSVEQLIAVSRLSAPPES